MFFVKDDILFFDQRGGKKYQVRLIKQIGRGGEAEVWKGKIHKGVRCAVKITIPSENGKGYLCIERHSYNQFRGIESIPVYYGWGKIEKQGIETEFIVIELLDDILQSVNLGPRDSLSFGIEALKILEMIHTHGFVFCDVSPSNFLFRPGRCEMILTDFGICEPFMRQSLETGESYHRPEIHRIENFQGTPLFASSRVLEGWTHSRKDDLEALGYVLLYLCGKLDIPNCSQKESAVIKRDLTCVDRTDPFSKIVVNYIENCRCLRFDQDPDYDWLCSILKY